eukprot:8199348-Lingulodinium_polyedra.AAC.1
MAVSTGVRLNRLWNSWKSPVKLTVAAFHAKEKRRGRRSGRPWSFGLSMPEMSRMPANAAP